MRYFIHALVCVSVCCVALRFSAGAPPAPPPDEPVWLQLPNNPVGDVLSYYEKLSGKVLVRDTNLAGPNLNIVVTQQIPKSEAIRLIEAALLLNGYSLVPDGDNHVKVINATGGKNPRSEGVPLYANSSAIPKDNQVISYFMQFRFVASSDAKNIFQQHAALHPYGSITEVPNAQAVVITENSALIRQLVNLQELIDVPPARVISEFVTLQRADAERVADVISKLIESQKADKQKRAASQPAPPPQNPGAPPNPAGAAPPATDLFENDLVSGSVQLIPDSRTNRILVITRPAGFAYIKNLIQEFDQAVGLGAPLDRPLKYVSAAEVLPVLADLLTENDQKGGQNGSSKNSQTSQQSSRQNQGTSYGGGSGSQTGANAHPDELSEAGDVGPTSLIVGKTRLIADNKANSILVIGAPESQEKVGTILDKLDKRPPQVYLSTVIGQLTLTNKNEFGVDYLKLYQGSSSGGVAGSVMNSTTSLVDPQTLTAASAFPATSGLSLYGTIGKSLSVYVHALESTNRFKVLARPAIYTANNKKAVISSGQRVAYPSSTLSNTSGTSNSTASVASSIEYEDVVLKLEVVPLINANKEVNLKIVQVDDSISGYQTISGNNVPTISTQKMNTTVTVSDGGTVVLGGLITDSITTNKSGIPILMNLPWVGKLFQDTTKTKERNELIILIQPQVVQSDEEMVEASMSETNRAQTGKDAYLFAQPPLPDAAAALRQPFFPTQSTGLKK